MLVGRIASQSEVIRAIVSGYSPCCGGARTWAADPLVQAGLLGREARRRVLGCRKAKVVA